MPRRKLMPKQPSPRSLDLVKMLEDEFKHPTEEREQPLILEEGGEGYQPLALYVIWDAWEDLSDEERSEIIMMAYENAEGIDEAAKVTVAMGLTEKEAREMKLIE